MIYLFIATGALHVEGSTPELDRRYVERLNAMANVIAADLTLGVQESLAQPQYRNQNVRVVLRSVQIEFSAGSIDYLARFVFEIAVAALASDPATAINNAIGIAGLCIMAVKTAMKGLEFFVGRLGPWEKSPPQSSAQPCIFLVDVSPYRSLPIKSGNNSITLNLIFFLLALCLLVQAMLTLQLVSMLP
jgi:hypothetical protein